MLAFSRVRAFIGRWEFLARFGIIQKPIKKKNKKNEAIKIFWVFFEK
jgi:hypothetical protein